MDPRVLKSQVWALCMSLLVSHYASTIKCISISGSQHIQSIYYDYSDIKKGGGCGSRLRDFTNIEQPLCTDINTRGITRLTGGPKYHQWHLNTDEWMVELSTGFSSGLQWQPLERWTVLSPGLSLASGKGNGELRNPTLKDNWNLEEGYHLFYLWMTLLLYKINDSGPKQTDMICNNLKECCSRTKKRQLWLVN